MPHAGKPLTIEDVEMVLAAVRKRKRNFPTEPDDITWLLILLNIGDRYTSVTCIEGEWIGVKHEIEVPEPGGIPKCPNGHPLTQASTKLTIGWIAMTDE